MLATAFLSSSSGSISSVAGAGIGSPSDHKGNALYRERVLREVVSLLANLCHFSLAACVELNSSNASGLTQLFLRLLESGEQTENTTKASVLRLLGNLCTWKQSFNLTSNANLLDRIASTIIHQEPALADKALRIVRYLSKRGCNSKVSYFVHL
uniref:Uncharacterized protein n=1 Tax=Ditylenchus dipsaci TaxID=166011 RepID=A0A915DEX8_9BILA